ncbi:MAG: ATP-dependent Clp protease adaptor ClpS, partial [Frankiales bacterium]|nr:ATP-dependent Clp protease adaptor ClpS [Frankiales bacterium]
MTAPAQLDRPGTDVQVSDDRPWVAIVWNDPVNLMSYVTHVLIELFDYTREVAEAM